ncbi:hypothetical protein LCGC14_0018860 [marine sediment metagenome]|uniref:Hydrogenase assembly chaperone HypC/HupF n=1 Tax=marine sediment metagenome TaxID=412755 RepID=A0A0F9W4Z9_9ZZZZ|nr:HypC/HybG/HupF family hydrogenase formation chaperone [Phycisphaerae bacterium]HDZ44901.1 HypC/HybG/HupF family hydrogenase formation chaperone [Phycisphaerae bacterium]
MCLAVPGKIIDIAQPAGADPAAAIGPTGTVDFCGNRVEVSLAMTPEAAVGDWVLVHAGFAITMLDEDEARETWAVLTEVIGADAPLPGSPAADA